MSLEDAKVQVDAVRDDAARVCVETAKLLRGERGPLRTPDIYGLAAEASDAAFGVASEVAMAAAEAMIAAGVGFRLDYPWDFAAVLLRDGWQRGHRLQAHVIGKGPKS